MSNKISVIDFETATSEHNSACAIGITVIDDGKIVEDVYYLIQPPMNKYDQFNIDIHGITPEMTAQSPLFPEVWKKIKGYFCNAYVAAHNTSFDMYVLKELFLYYQILKPHFIYFDTMYIFNNLIEGEFKKGLEPLCQRFEIDIKNHHNASADSHATAELIFKCFELGGYANYDEFFNDLDLKNIGNVFDKKIRTPKHKPTPLLAFCDIKSGKTQNQYILNKSFCFTGGLVSFTRADAETAVLVRGGTVKKGVSKNLNYLVNTNGDVLTSKVADAIKFKREGINIQIINEAQFLELLKSDEEDNELEDEDVDNINAEN